MIQKVLFWGDSITDGGRLKGRENQWDLNHQIGHCYAYLISAGLGFQYPRRDFRFFDRGVSGFRVSDLYAHLHEDVLPLRPDCVSILIGVNDCLQKFREGVGGSPEWFAQTYRLVLKELKKQLPGVSLILCEPFSLPVGDIGEDYSRWRAILEPLQAALPKLAEETGAVFVPLQKPFEDACKLRPASYWIWDGIHPTVSGHALLAREWEKAALPLLLSQR
ncbi:MAG TPA: SGNH/GDSL hydrolase family protein [Candidatus Merdivicinus excrementipullorum]|uniref:SGNH/GDSL hydrolase family protein n=1 Tax=Candidatus Merdivicinus excrementipullorum TaxID=2840867 RepID=A0A9D1K068_9FIRM|nr:SGNH/GDSL hydrolase family protein [Candidatus Merdivicinus excrementipullorum]